MQSVSTPASEEHLFADAGRPVGWPNRAVEVGSESAIDAVITWVDGSDEAHASARERYLALLERRAPRNGTDSRRFVEHQELRYCVRSIVNHAPWIRRIWIVTAGQVPGFLDLTRLHEDGVRLVDHQDLFGADDQLPTFNSLSIETVLHRIPGLAPRFIYFNDDMFLTGPVAPSDFFTRSGIVVHAARRSMGKQAFLHRRVTQNAAKLAEFSSFFLYPQHAPYPMIKRTLDQLQERMPDTFRGNSGHRFRSLKQFWPVSLHHHDLLRQGRVSMLGNRGLVHITLRNAARLSPDELVQSLNKMKRRRSKLACINDLGAVLNKVPEARSYLDRVTGPVLAGER